jgi:general secretion pathway protein L
MTIATDHPPKAARPRALPQRALQWWVAELAALYADSARLLGLGERGAVTIEAGERYWILRQRQRVIGQIDQDGGDADGRREALWRLAAPAARRGLVVEIPQERALSTVVALPGGARAELDRIVAFEISRQFPFPAERVFFAHRIAGRGRAARDPRIGSGRATGQAPGKSSGTIEVELVAVPRDIVAAIATELAAVGLRPTAIAVAGAPGAERLLLPAAALGPGAAARAPVRRALGVALAVLALAALVSWPLAQERRVARVEQAIARLKPHAEAVLAARARLSRDAERDGAVFGLLAARPPLVAVLAALTHAVPDGSWLLSLHISGRDIVIDGLSPSAATIALALEHSRTFTGIEFRSPITRDPASGLEHFELGAMIAPVEKPAPPPAMTRAPQ